MNFYKHHIGDYAKKTAHLSLLEHGAYLLMLHAYYGTEKPLPTGAALYRMVRAQSKAEREAVDSIAAQFWTTTETGLVNGRAFQEIETTTQLVRIARENGTRGGRPRKPSGLSKNNPVGFQIETQDKPNGKAIQTPDSRIEEERQPSAISQIGKSKPRKTRIPDDFALDPELEQYALDRLPAVNVPELLASFRGKAEAKGWEYVKWRQAFQEFVRNSAPNSHHFAAGQYPRKGQGSGGWT